MQAAVNTKDNTIFEVDNMYVADCVCIIRVVTDPRHSQSQTI